MILALGVGLILFDAVATTYLVVHRNRQRRRQRSLAPASPAAVERPAVVDRPAGCEHPSRAAVIEPPRVPRMRPVPMSATTTARQAAMQPLLDIWEAAETLAALQRLAYDPATWET